MKPARFEYVLAEGAAEALDILARHGETAKVLAGGQSLMPLPASERAMLSEGDLTVRVATGRRTTRPQPMRPLPLTGGRALDYAPRVRAPEGRHAA